MKVDFIVHVTASSHVLAKLIYPKSGDFGYLPAVPWRNGNAAELRNITKYGKNMAKNEDKPCLTCLHSTRVHFVSR